MPEYLTKILVILMAVYLCTYKKASTAEADNLNSLNILFLFYRGQKLRLLGLKTCLKLCTLVSNKITMVVLLFHLVMVR